MTKQAPWGLLGSYQVRPPCSSARWQWRTDRQAKSDAGWPVVCTAEALPEQRHEFFRHAVAAV